MKGTMILSLSLALACGSAAAANMANKDNDFAMKAAHGGAAEVELGKLAQTQGSDPKVKEFGQKMANDHSKAGDELKTAASGMDLPQEPDKKQKAAEERLGKMQGAQFDKEYARMMLKDHKEDIALFKKEANSGQDPNLKAYAQKTLPTLEEHLRMAEQLPGNSKASKD
jgi:putative membrane protein